MPTQLSERPANHLLLKGMGDDLIWAPNDTGGNLLKSMCDWRIE